MIEQILQADRLLQVDQVGKARDIYARVVELDPANAIATIGLARCALADGDDQAAHELAAKALQIDPENDMARRMEARMAEILIVRGEQVIRPDVARAPGPREMRPMVTDVPESVPEAVPKAEPESPPQPTPISGADAAPAGSDVAAPGPTVERRSFLDRLMGR